MGSSIKVPRPQSAKSAAHLKNKLVQRPLSASTNRKPQQSQAFQSIDPSLHFRPQSGKPQRGKKDNAEKVMMTNDQGVCEFKDLQIGQYTVRVEGNHLIHESSKDIEVKLDQGKLVVQTFVGVRAREDFMAKFDFVEQVQGRREQVHNVHEIDAKAVLLPDQKGQQQDLEEFDFDVLYDQQQKLWTSTLVSGTFLVTVKSKEFKEFN